MGYRSRDRYLGPPNWEKASRGRRQCFHDIAVGKYHLQIGNRMHYNCDVGRPITIHGDDGHWWTVEIDRIGPVKGREGALFRRQAAVKATHADRCPCLSTLPRGQVAFAEFARRARRNLRQE
jgi:hypothetical protein